jgi:hypothetical protein
MLSVVSGVEVIVIQALEPFIEPFTLFQFPVHSRGFLGWEFSQSQGRYLQDNINIE